MNKAVGAERSATLHAPPTPPPVSDLQADMLLAESAPRYDKLPSSRGLGHQIFILATRVRISLGVPST